MGYSPGMSQIQPKTPLEALHEMLHPCQKCGACCSFFRVSFYWLEADPSVDNPVPIEYTEDNGPRFRCMKGTNKKHHPKCDALSGSVGEIVSCMIYTNRPTPCREFTASYENGLKEPRCDEARAKHGLKPLTKDDYKVKNFETSSVARR